MPDGLKRYHSLGHDHFITYSCDQRRQYFNTPASRDLFQRSLELIRKRYKFGVLGYVVMPEHVHLLIEEPLLLPLDRAMLALKLSVSKRSKERPFWLTRSHDFNVFISRKYLEKLKYLHRNPVARGLVAKPEDWRWSSFRHYLFNEPGPVTIGRYKDLQPPKPLNRQ